MVHSLWIWQKCGSFAGFFMLRGSKTESAPLILSFDFISWLVPFGLTVDLPSIRLRSLESHQERVGGEVQRSHQRPSTFRQSRWNHRRRWQGGRHGVRAGRLIIWFDSRQYWQFSFEMNLASLRNERETIRKGDSDSMIKTGVRYNCYVCCM